MIIQRKTAFQYIGIGLVLSLITINFISAGIIVTGIGFIAMFLGFRRIRNSNPWFKVCFITSTARLAIFAITLIPQTMPSGDATLIYMSRISGFILHFTLLASLNFGIKAEMEKQQKHRGTGILSGIIVLYFIFSILILLFEDIQNTSIVLLLFITYIIIIIRFLVYFGRVDEWGQGITISTDKTGNTPCTISIVLLLTIVVTAGCFIETNDSIREELFHSEADTKLLEKNAAIPSDFYTAGTLLSQDNLDLIKDARRVEHSNAAINLDERNINVKEWFFYLPDGQVYGLNYFTMPDSSKTHFMDSMKTDLFFHASPVSGKIFYEKENKIFVKKMKALEDITNEDADDSYIYSQFRFPQNTKSHSGYILYEIFPEPDEWDEDGEYLEHFSIHSVITYHRSTNLYEILWNPTGLGADTYEEFDDFEDF